jgi:glycosyltransferase involved in cell wall biosynthesis
MATFHLITYTFFPQPGGMEESVLRIARVINSIQGWRAIVYVWSQDGEYDYRLPPVGLEVEVCSIGRERCELMTPLEQAKPTGPERYRTDFLLLRAAIRRSMSKSQGEQHAVVSFFLSHSGFVAQQLATSLDLPHVACARGSDVSRNCLDPTYQPIIAQVVQQADIVVTTNKEHLEFLSAAFGVQDKVVTIYNAIDEAGDIEDRVAHDGMGVRLFANCGYSFKKGTHILLSAFAVVASAQDVSLHLCGRTEPVEHAFWDRTRKEMEFRFASRIQLDSLLEKSRVTEKLIQADIYCSATLGEGCSLARSEALVMGKPIVSTYCGELADLADGASHVLLSEPGNIEAFTCNLVKACDSVRSNQVFIDKECVKLAREVLSHDREKRSWHALLSRIVSV